MEKPDHELEKKLDTLEFKMFLNTPQNLLPSQRDLFLSYWEVIRPVVANFIQRNFEPKKKDNK